MKTPNQYRVRTGLMGSGDTAGNNGCFIIPIPKEVSDCDNRLIAQVIASDGSGWEHVSVVINEYKGRFTKEQHTPTWDEMCFIKDLFWEKDETVVQFHPRESEYVNNHEHCLHLWKKEGTDFILPPKILIGL